MSQENSTGFVIVRNLIIAAAVIIILAALIPLGSVQNADPLRGTVEVEGVHAQTVVTERAEQTAGLRLAEDLARGARRGRCRHREGLRPCRAVQYE